jgi:hypothetical protein
MIIHNLKKKHNIQTKDTTPQNSTLERNPEHKTNHKTPHWRGIKSKDTYIHTGDELK